MRIIVALIFVMFSIDVYSKQIKVEIGLDISRDRGPWINIQVTNITSNIISCIEVRNIGLDGGISNPVFKVKKEDEDMHYLGSLASRNSDTLTVTLLAKHSVSSTINISELYDFSRDGVYEVQYDFSINRFCPSFQPYLLKSNKVRFVKKGNVLRVK